ncbi:MAG: NAD(P)-binding domain-containing protein [Rhodospirillales bacterium]|nr:NAD(P)-binding domain-containing protein [Rhodospirillales bacterium]
MLEAGFDVTLYEIGSCVGGLWVYNNDNQRSSAYKTLHINTARDLTAFSDHPFRPDVQPFPNHRDMATYLRSYAERFGLVSRVRFNTRITRVNAAASYTPEKPRWQLETEHGETHEHDTVIVASGHLTKPLEVPMFRDGFKGRYLHSHYYKDPAEFAGQRICVVGVGNSALDIASDVCPAAERAVLVARSRPLIIPKLMFAGRSGIWPSLSTSRGCRWRCATVCCASLYGWCRATSASSVFRRRARRFTLRPTPTSSTISTIAAWW